MGRTLTTTQETNVRANSTRPIYLVQLAHSGVVEYLSASGAITFDGILYAGGGVEVNSINGEVSVDLSLHASIERIHESFNGTWRNEKLCRVYGIPASVTDENIFDLDAGIELLDGFIDSSSYRVGDKVRVRGVQKTIDRSFTPRLNCSELSLHLPPEGTVFSWEGDQYTLVRAK